MEAFALEISGKRTGKKEYIKMTENRKINIEKMKVEETKKRKHKTKI